MGEFWGEKSEKSQISVSFKKSSLDFEDAIFRLSLLQL